MTRFSRLGVFGREGHEHLRSGVERHEHAQAEPTDYEDASPMPHNGPAFNGRPGAEPRWNHKDRSARPVRCSAGLSGSFAEGTLPDSLEDHGVRLVHDL